MADDNLIIKVVLDDGSVVDGFLNIERKSAQAGKGIEKNISKSFDGMKNGVDKVAPQFLSKIDDVASLAGELLSNPFVAAGATIAAVGVAINKAFDLALAGEKLQTIDRQFELLAERSGVFAATFKQDLLTASAGITDTTDLLQLANEAFIQIGGNARRFPELVALATKSVEVFGGDTVQALEKINNAIVSGNTKQLKSIGLAVDSERVFKKYAETINLSAGELTLAQRQQATLNAVLEEGNKQFNEAIRIGTPLTNTTKEVTVQIKEMGDQFSIFVSKNFGGFFAELTSHFVTFLKTVNGTQSAADEMSRLRVQIESTQRSLQAFANQPMKEKDPAFQARSEQLAALKSQLLDLQEIQRRSFQTAPGAKPEEAPGLTPEQLQSIRTKQLQAVQYQIEADKSVLNSKIAIAEAIRVPIERIAAIETLAAEQKLLLQKETANKIALAEVSNQDFSRLGLEKTEAQKRSILEASLFAQTQLQIKFDNEKIAQAASIAANMKNILVESTSSYIQQVGERLQAGEALFDDFGAGVVGIMGDMAISIGKTLFATGIAVEAFIDSINSLIPGSGIAAAAAGLGLILFGSVLKASVGKGGGASAPSSSGGGIVSSPGSSENSLLPDAADRAEPMTQVQVVIQGSVYDSDETGARIVDLINSAFDKRGVVVNQRAFA